MANVRLLSILTLSGALWLLAISAPFWIVHAQTSSQSEQPLATTSEEVAEAPASASEVPNASEIPGIRTETIPNPEDVIGDFVVGPGIFEAFGEPGDTIVKEMLITNRTGIDRRFNIEVEDVAGSSDGSRSVILLGDDRGPYSLKDYLSFPATSFELRHGQRARVPVTINIPEDAEPGGLYGSVIVNTVTLPGDREREEGRATVRSPIIKRIGSLFFITVPGENIYEGELVDFGITPEQSWYEKGPFNFVITFENTGSSHLNPYGEIRIENMFGEEVGFVELQPWFTLPQSVRLREVSWDRDMLYGKYTATLKLNRGYDDIVDEMSYSFWVIPWKFIALGFVGLFIIFFLLRSFFRTFEFKRKE